MTDDKDKNGIPLDLVRAARREESLRGRVHLCSTRREPLLVDGQVVGFVTPRQVGDAWRHGPIYVAPGFRSRGLVAAYYASHPERICVAFVADSNRSSRSAHVAAGFANWRRGKDGWFMRREAQP
jgi:hypothetical protein